YATLIERACDPHADGTKEMLGTIDETGGYAKGLEFGTYTYEVIAENYHSSEGRFTLNSQTKTHLEEVTLRMNGARITLTVPSEADIYVSGEKRGTRQWAGLLKAGNYQIECRQTNHQPSTQTIAVTEGNDQTITGKQGASVSMNGVDSPYSFTMRNLAATPLLPPSSAART
ncbi:MAG: hypothetical protein II801_04410, partial [Bacteroidaceae bacterium]|nr:hypothetical protein [Bacteroidaceae bacterium]